LPPDTGLIQLRLSEITKSDRTRTADVILAFLSSSGLTPGVWITRLRVIIGLSTEQAAQSDDFIFLHSDGTAWDSAYFRQTYLWPSLQAQRLAGDPFLRAFDGSSGNSIPAKFWSMHSYRRGGRTHVSRKREGCLRKATDAEVNEHGRWRQARRSMDMPTAYQEWSALDRLSITLQCM
jgi:hypothetical protein